MFLMACSPHNWAQVHAEQMWQMWQVQRCCRWCSAACNFPLHDWFGLGLVILTDLHTDLHVVAKAIWGKILIFTFRPYAGAMGHGFPLVCDNIWPMWLECVSTSWMMKALMLLTGLHVPPTLDRIKDLWDSKYQTHRCHVARQTVQLTDVLTQVWEEIWDEGFQCYLYHMFKEYFYLVVTHIYAVLKSIFNNLLPNG